MLFDIKPRRDKFLEGSFESSMKELELFFGIKWTKNRPNVLVVPDRRGFDLIFGRKTPGWSVGLAPGRDIYVLDHENYAKNSTHEYSKEHYRALVKHELTHVFCRVVSGKEMLYPFWLSEGLAMYLAGQNITRPRPLKFKSFLKYYTLHNEEVYAESGFAVELLLKKYGRRKILQLLKGLSGVASPKTFEELFAKIYGFRPTYGQFNGLLDKV
ncbi:MAG: hypothetical protein JW727_05305 [Candidatus Aenigmarchaeota archaeon]|nr:hypothetical protein [Candidatus Aenigmarchaeota archaeon]